MKEGKYRLEVYKKHREGDKKIYKAEDYDYAIYEKENGEKYLVIEGENGAKSV